MRTPPPPASPQRRASAKGYAFHECALCHAPALPRHNSPHGLCGGCQGKLEDVEAEDRARRTRRAAWRRGAA
jgi:hypothetical protein